ncbi:MAG: hypothetical protein WAV31_00975 [Candidatus Moraniibacteriota bacterium]
MKFRIIASILLIAATLTGYWLFYSSDQTTDKPETQQIEETTHKSPFITN